MAGAEDRKRLDRRPPLVLQVADALAECVARQLQRGIRDNIVLSDSGDWYQTGEIGEIIAFESVTPLGGGKYCIGLVWRSGYDTVPVTHLVGTRLYHIRVEAVGRRDWISGAAHARLRNSDLEAIVILA